MIETVTSFLATAPLGVLIGGLVVLVLIAGWISGMISHVTSFWRRVVAPALVVALVVGAIIVIFRYPDIATQAAWVAGGLLGAVIVFKIIGGIAKSRSGNRSSSSSRNGKDRPQKESRNNRNTDPRAEDNPHPATRNNADNNVNPRTQNTPKNKGDEPYRGVTF